ncbi:MAG: aldo/keto reductase [Clostridia bacterium]|nr:aldo/keto reductase [Clostridia bacterium]
MYIASENRYDKMIYRRCGKSGLKLPVVSLGMWHNFGSSSPYERSRELLHTAFDLGITHFDLANNYGPVYGAAEQTFGRVLAQDLRPYRDELVISTKAGWDMWPGPYGDFGSKKYLIASLDQSLKRMGLDYVDIFYHHRPDPETPLEETMGALAQIVRQGKALYVGISNYPSALAAQAIDILNDLGVHCLIEQPSYNMFNRWIEDDGLLNTLGDRGVGAIAFSPLCQGLLTNRYLGGIPADSRAAGESVFLNADGVTPEKIEKARALGEIAKKRGQTLAQLALAWDLRDNRMTSVIIGASKPSQIIDCAGVIDNLSISQEELEQIEQILNN